MGTDRTPYKRKIENVTATEVVGPRRMKSIIESRLQAMAKFIQSLTQFILWGLKSEQSSYALELYTMIRKTNTCQKYGISVKI